MDTATQAEFYDPGSVAALPAGKVYVADWDNNVVRVLSPLPRAATESLRRVR